MEHKVTASRRRPKNFDLLIGQEFVKTSLGNSLKSKKVANAYLFSGPRGVGKTSTARLLAKALENTNGIGIENLDFPGSSDIAHGQATDVYEIDGASNTSVEDIRKIKENIQYAPQVFRYKIYIIDEVHMLSISAFNALLKTIEEPPSYVVFIFATTEIHKVPITIKSRCQHFHFRLIPLNQIKEQLHEACIEEDITFEDEALLWIAKESGGSMRDAYTLFDQIVSFCQNHITMDKIVSKLSLFGMDKVDELVCDMILGDDPKSVFETLDNIIQSGVSQEQMCGEFINYFRSLLLLKNEITNPNIIGYDLKYFSKKVLDELEENQIQKILDLLFSYYRNLRNSINQRFEFELLVSKIIHIKKYIDNFELFSIARHLQNFITNANILNLTVEKYKPIETKKQQSNLTQNSNGDNSGNNSDSIPKATQKQDADIDSSLKDDTENISDATDNTAEDYIDEPNEDYDYQNAESPDEINEENTDELQDDELDNTEILSSETFIKHMCDNLPIDNVLKSRFEVGLEIEFLQDSILINVNPSIYSNLIEYNEKINEFCQEKYGKKVSICQTVDYIREAIEKYLGIKIL